MTAVSLDTPLRLAAIGAIRAYQRWLSPFKGFRCAHQVVHGQGSCSHYALTVFQAHSFAHARALLRERFEACAQAYRIYKSEADGGEGEAGKQPEPRAKTNRFGASFCDMLSIADCSAINGCELGSCDAGACDIGSCSW